LSSLCSNTSGRAPGRWTVKSGPRTRNAIAGFQRPQGAAVTGETDAGLLGALEADTRRGFGHNRIADIRLVQPLLAIRGFDRGGIDGIVGPRTTAAIAALIRADRGSAPDAADAWVLDALLARG
jgi:peptidoglycan hydrolase-like protein with peptidoglycan-binding domain